MLKNNIFQPKKLKFKAIVGDTLHSRLLFEYAHMLQKAANLLLLLLLLLLNFINVFIMLAS